MYTIEENAPVVVRLSTDIDAPAAAVWELHTAVDAWPTWNAGVESARLDGPLRPGTTFTWRTHGLDITSTVREIVPGERIVWGGPSAGITGVHVWTFERTGDRVTVRTEESWSGAPAEARPDALRTALHQSLEAWLTALKAQAERAR
ncbi:SRPBCC family protein [Streptomyces sp. NPDC029006]|uniref:SRPBCC family protein n=1 Tax=Streptomyces sp. NPDC029006 TaxID=3155467 RepID=UPI0033E88DF7